MTSRLVILVLLGVCCSADAFAQTVRVRTTTIGRGTHFRRSDLSREAERFFSQSVSIWGWDALPLAPGVVDVQASARYIDDFGVRVEDRGNPFVETERSRFILDIAQVRYRPVPQVTLVGGRQWVPSALGMRDIDGGRLRLQAGLGGGARTWADGFIGREVASGWATINSDAWDVQGLPIDEHGAAPGGLRLGGDVGLDIDGGKLSVAWQRRTEPAAEGRVGDERIGVAISGNVHRLVTVSSSASYHLWLGAVDRADLHVAWKDPWLESVLSAGIEHRRPWFDASSIFNVFGARPFEGAYLTWQLPVAAVSTTFEARGWGRAYDANLDLTDLGGGEDDARALGAGVGHTTRLRVLDRAWRWRSYFSTQSSVDGAQGGTQWLADTGASVPVVRDALTLEGRVLAMWVSPGEASSWRAGWRNGGALTGVMGMLVPTSFGDFRLQVEGQSSAFYGANLNAYASFVTELWL